jgi:hypothetical protein
MGWNYATLHGNDCSCFPWLKRVVGPMFFVEDAAMLAVAVMAGIWSRRAEGFNRALLALAAVVVFAGGVYTYQAAHQGAVVAPASITVDGKPFPLQEGRVFVFFYDPECSHCYAAAKDMATYRWKPDIHLIGVPTTQPQWGAIFLKRTAFHIGLSLDSALLRKSFTFTDPPYGVALEDGRLKQPLPYYDDTEPRKSLKALGWID